MPQRFRPALFVLSVGAVAGLLTGCTPSAEAATPTPSPSPTGKPAYPDEEGFYLYCTPIDRTPGFYCTPVDGKGPDGGVPTPFPTPQPTSTPQPTPLPTPIPTPTPDPTSTPEPQPTSPPSFEPTPIEPPDPGSDGEESVPERDE